MTEVAEEVKGCKCGREGQYLACSHVAAGEVKEIEISGTGATCSECSKFKPDDSFAPVCRLCLDRMAGPPDPQGDLDKILAEESELADVVKKAQAELDQREKIKAELQRRLSQDLVEAFFMGLVEFIQMLKPGGHVAERYDALVELAVKIKALNPDFPANLSTSAHDAVLDRKDPVVAYLVDALVGGSFAADTPLSQTLLRLAKNKASPIWEG
jgi:hypothetical protein